MPNGECLGRQGSSHAPLAEGGTTIEPGSTAWGVKQGERSLRACEGELFTFLPGKWTHQIALHQDDQMALSMQHMDIPEQQVSAALLILSRHNAARMCLCNRPLSLLARHKKAANSLAYRVVVPPRPAPRPTTTALSPTR